MLTPKYGFDIMENCTSCKLRVAGSFCDLPARALAAFENLKYASLFPDNAILFAEGHEAHGVFVLCRGRVKLSFSSVDGKTIIIRIAQPGELLGLSAALIGKPYMMTAETIQPCQVSFIKRDDFLRLLNGYGEVAFAVTGQMAEHYMFACRELRAFNLAQSAAEKVAKLLLEWSTRTGGHGEGAESTIDLALTHEEMGQMIGTSRETVTRVLMEMKKRQIVRTRGNALTIRDRGALKKLAEASEFIRLH
jgi:CRP/FNR family transcriptional regulator